MPSVRRSRIVRDKYAIFTFAVLPYVPASVVISSGWQPSGAREEVAAAPRPLISESGAQVRAEPVSGWLGGSAPSMETGFDLVQTGALAGKQCRVSFKYGPGEYVRGLPPKSAV